MKVPTSVNRVGIWNIPSKWTDESLFSKLLPFCFRITPHGNRERAVYIPIPPFSLPNMLVKNLSTTFSIPEGVLTDAIKGTAEYLDPAMLWGKV
jgi:hypothetical protein